MSKIYFNFQKFRIESKKEAVTYVYYIIMKIYDRDLQHSKYNLKQYRCFIVSHFIYVSVECRAWSV